ncbi:type II toxin-antitoxin system RelE family toxin [Desulfoferrobacter suflitae]|uniref:type II toxin-antitoxin system RelE family toxin n=1 Tax=Desulfoferrobacter suflitae TaxID=2865782 RepID=UPI00338DACE6
MKFLRPLPARQYRQIFNKIPALMEDPEPSDSSPLRGYPYRRADIGEYRILYRVEQDCLKVALVGKRNDDAIYRRLQST